jgi:hypothetical protein
MAKPAITLQEGLSRHCCLVFDPCDGDCSHPAQDEDLPAVLATDDEKLIVTGSGDYIVLG